MENLDIQSEGKSSNIYAIVIILLLVLSGISVFIFSLYGVKFGVLPLAILLGLTFIYIVIKEPKFAVIALLSGAYFIIFFILIRYNFFFHFFLFY